MNFKAVGKILGLLLLLLTFGMTLPLGIAIYDFSQKTSPTSALPLQGILSGILKGFLNGNVEGSEML